MPHPPGSGKDPGKQRRAAVRLSVAKVSCELWLPVPGASRMVRAQVVNVSEGGLLLEVDEAPELGVEVYCRLTLPSGPVLDNLAEVMRVEPAQRSRRARLGLRFLGMAEARRDQLVGWIFAMLARRRRA